MTYTVGIGAGRIMGFLACGSDGRKRKKSATALQCRPDDGTAALLRSW
jgi:hypothetical protein